MYESFGAVVSGSSVTFKLFFPDSSVDPAQYTRGGVPRIQRLRVVGTFQPVLGQAVWDLAAAPEMIRTPHPSGWLYSFAIPHLPNGFYEYHYFADFENGTSRRCIDPCSKYDGSVATNSAFVLGGNNMVVRAIGQRLSLQDLVAYELMIDDFTAEFRGTRAPLDAILDKLDYLDELGVNAIQFMPWTAWPDDDFSWGYNPYAFFSVEHRYYDDPAAPLDKLFRLKRLIDELHRRGKHVIMDGVFNHVEGGQAPDKGFPYLWLYQDAADSPYVGVFEGHSYFNDLDFSNSCTAQFIEDVCKYWIDEYKIDGIRFDYALGYYKQADQPVGITRVIRDLNAYAATQGLNNLSFTLELLTDDRYAAVGKTNEIQASGCWYDRFMYDSFDVGRTGVLTAKYLRALNSGKDFDSTRRPVTYIENHDHSTIVEQCGGRDRWWRTQPLAVALFSMSGAPLIHNGQEFGEQYGFPEEGNDRVRSRHLRWARSTDSTGTWLRQFYKKLIGIRAAHPALRGQLFYPDPYDEQWSHFNGEGYGIDVDKAIAIFHRWGSDEQGRLERFIVVLNFSFSDRTVDVPFSANGQWSELLEDGLVQVNDFRLRGERIPSNWGRVYWRLG
jgi:pullulanase/glycogen debranching enzyme